MSKRKVGRSQQLVALKGGSKNSPYPQRRKYFEAEAWVMEFESGKNQHDNADRSNFKTQDVSGKWEMERD